jgi:uncharacterized protein YneF (UPF0154 family)
VGTLILILLLLAALTGVFWTVLKVTAIAILSTILTIMVLVWIGFWFVKRRFNRFVSDPRIQEQVRRHQQGHDGAPGRGGAIPARGWKKPEEPPSG